MGAAELGHLPGMVADHALRLVAALLLLVQDDEAGIWQGGKHRRPGADDHGGLPVPHPLPLVIPLPGGQAAVKDCHLPAKVGQEDLQQAGGEGDLRHQHHGPPPCGQCRLDQVEVHLGLAAAGHPIEEGGLGLPAFHPVPQAGVGRLLLGVEVGQRLDLNRLRQGVAEHLPLVEGEDPPLLQTLDGLAGGPGEVAQLLDAGAAQVAQQAGHRIAHGGRGFPGRHLRQGLLGG